MFEQYAKVLSEIDLFQNIDLRNLESMFGCIRPRKASFQKGEIISIEGEAFNGLGVVLEGEVMVSKENAAGNRMVMGKMATGQLFGEIIAFSSIQKWPATVTATEDSVVMFIESSRILGSCDRTCDHHRTLILNMLRIVSRKALNLNKKVEYLSIKGMREKLATYFLEQYKQNGKKTFNLDLNRNELSDFLNVSRPSMSREIARMKDDGIIDFYKSTFKILDMDLLTDCIR